MLKKTPLILICLIFASCSARGPKPNSLKALGYKIGSVEVSLKSKQREGGVEQVYNATNGSQKIQEWALKFLKDFSLYDDSSNISLEMVVDDLRLRGEGAAGAALAVPLVGLFAEKDFLSADVTVVQDGRILSAFDVAKEASRGTFSVSNEARIANLYHDIGLLAARNVEGSPLMNPGQIISYKQSAGANLTKSSSSYSENVQNSALANPASHKASVGTPAAKRSGKCTTDQILSMTRSGLSDEQVRRACE